MPLYLYEKLEDEVELGLWIVEESEDWFFEQLELNSAEQDQFDTIKGRKRVEWLAVRYLVHQMSGRKKRGAFFKDEFGKPHLEHSRYQISISHSHEMAAAIAAPISVGIDIQFIVPKIERIAHKFMRPEEMASLEDPTRIEHLHVYWGAKEALYKAYGRRELDFCAHIHIDPFAFDPSSGQFTGKIQKDAHLSKYQLSYRQDGEYILVYAKETQ